MFHYSSNAWLIPFLPLLARWWRPSARSGCGSSHIPVVAGIALAFLVSLGLLFSAGHMKRQSWAAG